MCHVQGVQRLAALSTQALPPTPTSLLVGALVRTALPLVGSHGCMDSASGGVSAAPLAAAAGLWGLLRVAASELGAQVSLGLEQVSMECVITQ